MQRRPTSDRHNENFQRPDYNMPTHQQLERLDIEVHDTDQLEHLLNQAELSLRETALTAGQHGILVTRLSSRQYTLELSSSVPFGQTREQCLLAPSA